MECDDMYPNTFNTILAARHACDADDSCGGYFHKYCLNGELNLPTIPIQLCNVTSTYVLKMDGGPPDYPNYEVSHPCIWHKNHAMKGIS